MTEHHLFMRRSFELAAMAKGRVAPNPMVGAVLVHQGRVIGEGYHKAFGGPHAEINCLDAVLPEDQKYIAQSTLYVNLEPCAHFGKTPPCALRLAREKVHEVIICNTDPFEKVSGKGLDILRTAGISTETGFLENEGLWLNRRFFCFHQQKRPYIILKWAQTSQGFMAPSDRSRFQLSNQHSQQLVHKWRTEEAAILVGTTTGLQDNPKLSARLWKGPQPLRIVLDRQLKIPHSHHLFDGTTRTWIVNETKHKEDGETVYVQLDFAKTILPQLMSKLHEHNILSLIVEGGAALLKSFTDQNLWDEARIFETENVLSEGIKAPSLQHAVPAFSTQILSDHLHVFVNENSAYPYVPQMEL